MLTKRTKFPIPAGSKVKLRTWASMKKEYGLDSDGDIQIPYCFFVSNMRNLAGKIVTLIEPIKGFGENNYGVIAEWQISAEMVDKIIKRSKYSSEEFEALKARINK